MEDLSKYAHSPAHLFVLRHDYVALRRTVAALPRLAKAGEVNTEAESLAAEQDADAVSSVIDRRDVPGRETPLHLAVRLRDAISAEILMAAGADWSLQNENGWSALQEAVCTREENIAMIIARHYQPLAWAKWCRRLPRIVASAARIRDFYMEISFHFESSVIPFISRIAPSDTYRIWKRGSNLRADMTLAGFDGFRIQRSDQTFLFLGEGHSSEDVNVSLPPGSLIVLAHKEKEITNAFEGAGVQPSEAEVAHEVALMSQTNMYRPGIDVTQAELVSHLNWRRQERTEYGWYLESQGEHEDYDDVLTAEERLQLDSALRTGAGFGEDEDSEVQDCHENLNGAKTPGDEPEDSKSLKFSKLASDDSKQKSIDSQRSSSEFLREDGGDLKKSKDKSGKKKKKKGTSGEPKNESEYKKGLRPVLWLTPDFPLKTEELLPLLDILANKVKAVRRLRELLTTKLPPGTFPVKIAIPIVPTIRVLVTFTKFEELQPTEEFSTPLSSPAHFQDGKSKESESSTSWISWMRGSRSGQSSDSEGRSFRDDVDPFHIPSDYTWVDANEKRRRMKAKKAKSKKHKRHGTTRNPDGTHIE
ncbi:Ankyrin repeat family protein isoform 1 [Dorcoceras hygrometricum]|uniref:Ankyrin repeat family protein isoform 1 n=1 Tax=Dorcoceras hygrometricum TaxID=472368 RepID=A0A2Z7ALB4_9LAMI|nr:Ankyrin repeat family protein isoform 1 [Dorcoceras hygrometricum]